MVDRATTGSQKDFQVLDMAARWRQRPDTASTFSGAQIGIGKPRSSFIARHGGHDHKQDGASRFAGLTVQHFSSPRSAQIRFRYHT